MNRRNRRRARSAATGCLLALALALAAAPAGADDREALESLRARIEALRRNISGAEEVQAEARDQLRESERAISQANRELRDLVARRESARARIQQLGAGTQSAQSEISARREALGRLLAQRYVNGEAGYARLLLSGKDPNQVSRELHYYGYLSRAQAGFIERLRETVARLQDLERQTSAGNAELTAIEAEQKANRAALIGQQSEKRRVLAKVSGQLREQRREVRHLERDQARLSRLVEEISKAIAAAPTGRRTTKVPEAGARVRAFAELRGKLRLPIRGELVNRFGAPRPGGGPAWRGLFIRAAAGQEVRAVAPGRIVFAEWMRGFGNLLIVDHGDSYLTIYGNGEALLKQVGDIVGSGEVIATVGNSGGNVDSGLYFEARHQGRPFDPLRWVSSR